MARGRGVPRHLLGVQEAVDEDERLHGLAHAHAVGQDAASIARLMRAVLDAEEPLHALPLQWAETPPKAAHHSGVGARRREHATALRGREVSRLS